MKRTTWIVLLAGAVPLIAVHLAYATNLAWGDIVVCYPPLNGCTSISASVRAGPGIYVYRILAVPAAVLFVFSWVLLADWLRLVNAGKPRLMRIMRLFGILGALFFIVYINFLGEDVSFAGLGKRIGVAGYFLFTALAQLLLVVIIWPHRRRIIRDHAGHPVSWLLGLVILEWTIGVGFAVLRRSYDFSEQTLFQLTNLAEWNYAFSMVGTYIAIAWMFQSSRFETHTRLGE